MRLILLFLLIPLFAFSGQKPIIILDPGHGGKDEGAKVRNMEEKKMTLRTAYLTKKHLEALGYPVVLTRARDVFLPLKTRTMLANKRPSGLFVSIHYNSAKSPVAQGIEIYYYGSSLEKRREESRKMASAILDAMVFETKASSRGVKKGNFQVIRETAMPAVLIEAGFLTNSEERARLSTQTYLDQLGKGIAEGVDKFVRTRRM